MTRPTIVLLHGWGIDSSIWQPLQSLLNDYRVMTLDLPGYGNQIDNTTAWRLDSLAEDLASRSPKGALWVGWSLGGLLGLNLALRQPNHIGGLLTLASTPCFIQRPDWSCAMEQQIFNNFKQSCQNNAEQSLHKFKGLTALGGDNTTAVQLRALNSQVGRETLLSGLEILENTDLRLAIKNLRCPTQLLFAANDALVPISIVKHIDEFLTTAVSTVVSGASHALPLSHANIIAQQIATLRHTAYG